LLAVLAPRAFASGDATCAADVAGLEKWASATVLATGATASGQIPHRDLAVAGSKR